MQRKKNGELRQRRMKCTGEKQKEFHKQQSRLESLKNIAERYDGYGNSIRKVMEQKNNPGLTRSCIRSDSGG